MDRRPVCLVVAGLDPSGGAGLAADLAACAAHGVWGAPVATAITVQDTARVHEVAPLDPGLVARQVSAVVADLSPAAVKVGMLGSAAIARALVLPPVPVVLDPVLSASVGGELLDDPSVLVGLLPAVTVITPNALEAERLTGIAVHSREAMEAAGRALVGLGAAAALVKGGHVDLGDERSADCLVVDGRVVWFDGPRLTGVATHGTGCVLSTSIAARLARGRSLLEAVEGAKAFLLRAMTAGPTLGAGPGALDPWSAR